MRDSTMNIRTSKADRTLIERAVEITGQNKTEFLLEAVREKAVQVLLDQTLFVVNDGKFADLKRLLEAPLPDAQMAALRALRQQVAPWDQVPTKRVAGSR